MRPRHILPVIVFAQFAGTSLWFSGNAVLTDLQQALGLGANALAGVTSAVQLGFIAGTLPSNTIFDSVTRSRLLALIVIGILLEPFIGGSGLENQARGHRDGRGDRTSNFIFGGAIHSMT